MTRIEMATPTTLLRFVALFVPAGLCEIDGGWLIRNWLRNDRPCRWGLLGGLVLIPYGVIPTLQTSHFGRAYVAHGGFFVLLSLLWGQGLDSDRPHPAVRARSGRAGEIVTKIVTSQPSQKPLTVTLLLKKVY